MKFSPAYIHTALMNATLLKPLGAKAGRLCQSVWELCVRSEGEGNGLSNCD